LISFALREKKAVSAPAVMAVISNSAKIIIINMVILAVGIAGICNKRGYRNVSPSGELSKLN